MLHTRDSSQLELTMRVWTSHVIPSLQMQTPNLMLDHNSQCLAQSLALSVSDRVWGSLSTEPVQYTVGLVSQYRHCYTRNAWQWFEPANYVIPIQVT